MYKNFGDLPCLLESGVLNGCQHLENIETCTTGRACPRSEQAYLLVTMQPNAKVTNEIYRAVAIGHTHLEDQRPLRLLLMHAVTTYHVGVLGGSARGQGGI